MHRQQDARGLDDRGHLALLLGGEARVLARQDLAGIGDETGEILRRRERDVLREDALLLLFGAAHVGKRSGKVGFQTPSVNGHF